MSMTDGGTQTAEEDLWSSILSDVSTSSAPRHRVEPKNLVVLGDVNTGKNSLIAKLRNRDQSEVDEARGCGMEYMYLDVKYEDFDDIFARLGVWILDGDERYQPLLNYCLNENTVEHSVAMIVLDMSRPWTAMDALDRWTKVLREHLDSLKIPPRERKEQEERQVRFFQQYTDPDDTTQVAQSSDEEKVLLPLGETVLCDNLGLPLIVVGAKADGFSQLVKEHDFHDEHFDFIQQHLRKFCLRFGATLVYASSKDGHNCDVLFRYIVHRAYGQPFNTPASVVERDAVFVPTGWDNEKKISILYEHMASMSPDDVYTDRIPEPLSRKLNSEQALISAEEDQIFLLRQQAHLGKPAAQTTPAARPPENVMKTQRSPGTDRRVTTTKKDAPKPGAQSGETVLASFFQSLLQKKPAGGGAGRAGGAGGNSAPSQADVKAAFQSMKKS